MLLLPVEVEGVVIFKEELDEELDEELVEELDETLDEETDEAVVEELDAAGLTFVVFVVPVSLVEEPETQNRSQYGTQNISPALGLDCVCGLFELV